MSGDGAGGLRENRFADKVAGKLKVTPETVVERRVTEAKAHQAIDGRLSSREDKAKKGYAQLNVRLPLDLKNQVIEERSRRQARRVKNADIASIVEEALRAFLARAQA